MKVIELWQCVGWGLGVGFPVILAYTFGHERGRSHNPEDSGVILLVAFMAQVALSIACYKAGAH